jgi:heat shock protein HtpX
MLKTALLLAAITALFVACGALLGGSQGMALAFIFALVGNAMAYWFSDRMVLSMYRARELSAGEAGDLPGMVARLAVRAGIPAPRTYLIESAQPNAFATGRSPSHAAVAVTSGLLALLTQDELEGVVAHELAHIKNRDTLIMTITATLAGAISALGNFALFFGGRDSSGQPRNPLAMLAVALLAPFAAMLVQLAISRTREYSADATGATITGNPMGLASALSKIEQAAQHAVNPQAERNPATAHLFIINPLLGRGVDPLFSTHPRTQNRISALQSLASGLPRRVAAARAKRGTFSFTRRQ